MVGGCGGNSRESRSSVLMNINVVSGVPVFAGMQAFAGILAPVKMRVLKLICGGEGFLTLC